MLTFQISEILLLRVDRLKRIYILEIDAFEILIKPLIFIRYKEMTKAVLAYLVTHTRC